ncbi:hypothetical protein LRD18_11405 [Halorhodospira halochloris]|uniref:hypothetical protein n=1 Tax=Halorhodospira halochloris TaxID=1052 RepID=UPI001EE8CB4F|nr:hypothetical protein [Halorhodospira halochloris]MCG5531452.1 hypothetical protein [Halorhodospira halochloris]
MSAWRWLTVMLFAAATLGGCGISDDDDDDNGNGNGDPTPSEHTVEGVVLGGTDDTGEVQVLSGYTVCIDLERTWTCQDPEPEADYRTETEEDGTFALSFEHEGSIEDYALIAEPSGLAAAVSASSGVVATSDSSYGLSSTTALVDPDEAVISPLTTLISEAWQVSTRSPEHLSERLAAALGVDPETDLAVDYRDGVDAITGDADKGYRDLAGGLDALLRKLQAELQSEGSGRWTNNPGAVRNLLADRAFAYAGLVAEGAVEAQADAIDFDTGVFDLDLAGRSRERLQQLREEEDTDTGVRYPQSPYVLAAGSDGLGWRAWHFERDDDGADVGYGYSALADLDADPLGLEPDAHERDLPREQPARGVRCTLDDPLRVRLSYAADAPWPVYHLIGEGRWRIHALEADLPAEQTFGRNPDRHLYRGGVSCEAEGRGHVDPSYAEAYLRAGEHEDVVRLTEEHWVDAPDALPGNWGALLDQKPVFEPPQPSLGERWEVLSTTEAFDKHRGLIEIRGGQRPGVFRFETFSQTDAVGERFLYIDTTPSGEPYGQLLRLSTQSSVCDGASWCVLARAFFAGGSEQRGLVASQ